jgi:replicative DNA helicase
VLESIGGVDYLLKLQDSAIIASHSQWYADIVKEKFIIRKKIKCGKKYLKDLYDGNDNTDDLIAELLGDPLEEKNDYKSIVDEWKLSQSGQRITIPTPFISIDRQSGGLRQGMVHILTGKSKSGKSMLLSHWYNYLGQQGISSLAVPLEDKYETTIKRMASNLSNIETGILDRGGYYISINNGERWEWNASTDKDIEKGEQALKTVSNYPIHFWDRKCTPKQLKGIALRFKRKHDIKVMFVDGCKDLLRPPGKYGDVGFDEQVSQELVDIAHSLNIAVVAVHHLTKLPDNEKITVDKIRGSSNIVADARSVYALQSSGIEGVLAEAGYSAQYNDAGKLTTRIFECLVNNHGSNSSVCLQTELNRCQFKEVKKQQ